MSAEIYIPAVVVVCEDSKPHLEAPWLRKLSKPSASEVTRLVVCDDQPHELALDSHTNAFLWRAARQHVLADISEARVASRCAPHITPSIVGHVLQCLRAELNLYTQRQRRR